MAPQTQARLLPHRLTQRQCMKVLKSGRFDQNQAHSPEVVICGQKGLEIGGGDMIWPSFELAPVHEETVAKTSHHGQDQHSVVMARIRQRTLLNGSNRWAKTAESGDATVFPWEISIRVETC